MTFCFAPNGGTVFAWTSLCASQRKEALRMVLRDRRRSGSRFVCQSRESRPFFEGFTRRVSEGAGGYRRAH